MKCVNLNNEIVKILAVQFSYNKNLKQGKVFCGSIVKIENIFCIKYRKTLFGKGKRQKLNIVPFAMAMKIQLIFCIKYRKLDLAKEKDKN